MKKPPARAFRDMTTSKNLTLIYYDAIAATNSVGRDGRKPETIAADIKETTRFLRKSMRAGSYQFTAYRQVLKLKSATAPPRIIAVATARDRIVLRCMADYLKAVFDFPQLEAPQRKVRRLRQALSNSNYDHCIKLDIQNFYPNIDHRILLDKLSQRVTDPRVVKLFENAITAPIIADHASRKGLTSSVGVPQGLSISNLLAELLLLDVDRYFSSMASIEYFRYVDDIVILCSGADEMALKNDLHLSLEALKLESHAFGSGKSVSRKLSQKFEYLGYSFVGSLVSVRSDNRLRLERAIVRVFTRYKYALLNRRPSFSQLAWEKRCAEVCNWYLRLLVYGYIHERTKHGWINYFAQINDLTMLTQFDLLISKLGQKSGIDSGAFDVSFVTSYWSVTKRGNRSRMPNFDVMAIGDKKQILSHYYFFTPSKLSNMDALEVESSFNAAIKRTSVEIEKDIGSNS